MADHYALSCPKVDRIEAIRDIAARDEEGTTRNKREYIANLSKVCYSTLSI